MMKCYFKYNSLLLAVAIATAICAQSLNINQIFAPFEYMSIRLNAFGDLSILISCYSIIDIGDLINFNNLYEFHINLECKENGATSISCKAAYILRDVSTEVGRMEIYNLIKYFCNFLDCNFKILNEKIEKTIDPITGKRYVDKLTIEFTFLCNANHLVELFLKLKPDGLLDMVDYSILKPPYLIKMRIENPITAAEALHILLSENEVPIDFTFIKRLRSYFKLEYGKMYIIDVAKIFNYTLPIRTCSKSSTGTFIEIMLDIPGFADYEFIEIKPKFFIAGGPRKGKYTLTNVFPPNPFPAGTIIGNVYVKFKVIQRGLVLKPPTMSPKFLGFVFLSIAITIMICLTYLFIRRGILTRR